MNEDILYLTAREVEQIKQAISRPAKVNEGLRRLLEDEGAWDTPTDDHVGED